MREDYLNIRDFDAIAMSLLTAIADERQTNPERGGKLPDLETVVSFVSGMVYATQITWSLHQNDDLPDEAMHAIKDRIIEETVAKVTMKADLLAKKVSSLEFIKPDFIASEEFAHMVASQRNIDEYELLSTDEMLDELIEAEHIPKEIVDEIRKRPDEVGICPMKMAPYSLPGIEKAILENVEEDIEKMFERHQSDAPDFVKDGLLEAAKKLKRKYESDGGDTDIVDRAAKATEGKEWSLKDRMAKIKEKKEAKRETNDGK